MMMMIMVLIMMIMVMIMLMMMMMIMKMKVSMKNDAGCWNIAHIFCLSFVKYYINVFSNFS